MSKWVRTTAPAHYGNQLVLPEITATLFKKMHCCLSPVHGDWEPLSTTYNPRMTIRASAENPLTASLLFSRWRLSVRRLCWTSLLNTKIIAASTDEAFVPSDKQSSAEEIDSGWLKGKWVLKPWVQDIRFISTIRVFWQLPHSSKLIGLKTQPYLLV